jgi:hypothetical protein
VDRIAGPFAAKDVEDRGLGIEVGARGEIAGALVDATERRPEATEEDARARPCRRDGDLDVGRYARMAADQRSLLDGLRLRIRGRSGRAGDP